MKRSFRYLMAQVRKEPGNEHRRQGALALQTAAGESAAHHAGRPRARRGLGAAALRLHRRAQLGARRGLPLP